MTKANPNTCPHCGSSNSGATFGFNPQPINDDETLIHDVLFACAAFGGRWTAMGFVMVARRNGKRPRKKQEQH